MYCICDHKRYMQQMECDHVLRGGLFCDHIMGDGASKPFLSANLQNYPAKLQIYATN